MKRKVKLKFYVLRWDWNENKIKNYNVLGDNLIEDIYKNVKKHKIQTITELKKFLKREFMYYYWSKAEAEIIMSDFSGRYEEKIDIYRQLEMNLDLITEYINNKMQLELKEV